VSVTYDDLATLLRARHSCRAFSPRALDARTLDALRAAFALAPQAGGGRDLACSFVTERAAIEDLAACGARAFAGLCATLPSTFIREEMTRYGENFFWWRDAPALAFVTCRKPPVFLAQAMPDKAAALWGGELSAGMAAFALLLAAESLGLGACCLTGPLAVWREMETRLGVGGRDELVLMMALGHRRDEA